MRPLFFHYHHDPRVWEVEDQFMLGRDYLVAPVTEYQARSRVVYFPSGDSWRHHFTNVTFEGGAERTVDAPLNEFPLFHRVIE